MKNKILIAMALITGCFYSKEGSDSENRRNMNSSIFKSAYEGNAKEVEGYLDRGVNIDSKENGNTALHYAAQNGHKEVVKLLLLRNANSFLYNNEGRSSYDIAKNKETKEIIKKYSLNEEGQSIIEEAVIKYSHKSNELEIIKKIIAEGAVFNIGSRPELEIAAKSDYQDIVNLLLDSGADAKVGFPLAYAKSLNVIEALLDKGANINLPDAKVLSINGNIAKLLLEKGVNPNTQNSQGKTALMYAAESRDYKTAVAAIEALLEAGAKLSIKDEDGNTALHHFNLNNINTSIIENIKKALLKASDVEEAKKIKNNKGDLADIN